MEDFILKLARQVIEAHVSGKKMPSPKAYPKELGERKGVFVTLIKDGQLRGCIGFPYPQMPLIDGLLEAAVDVCHDPRFPPLAKEELKDVRIEVSVLTKPELIEAKGKDLLKEIVPGKDGLILQKGRCSGLFLPQVWEQLPDKEDFLVALCAKAGLLGDEWLDPQAKIYKFQVKIFKER